MNFNIGSLSFVLKNPLQDSVLLIILILITVFAYFLMKYLRGKRATYFGNIKTLRRTHGYKVFHISVFVLIIKIILIIMLYMVATNSIMIRNYKPVSNTDYILLLDDSSSMAKSDFKPNRLISAKTIAQKWINILPNSTRIGLVAFSKDIDVSTGLIQDTNSALEKLNDIQIDYTKSGTDLDYALTYSINLLNKDEINEDNKRNKTILLLTDGTQNINNKTIIKAKNNNIKIIIFGIGDNTNSKEESLNIPREFRDSYNNLDFNFTSLENIANETNGLAFKVSNSQELENSFNQATLEEIQIKLDSAYYVTILIAIMSILELLIYSKIGAL